LEGKIDSVKFGKTEQIVSVVGLGGREFYAPMGMSGKPGE